MESNDRKIIDYTVIVACNSGALVDSVFEHIEAGWRPFGGVCLAYERNIHRELGPKDGRYPEGANAAVSNLPNDFEHYAQALVKYEMFPGSSGLEKG